MGSFWVLSCFLLSVISLPVSMAQLTPTEGRILLQVQQLLEYPEALRWWNNWTSFCYLPPSPSLKIVCTDNRVTELTIVGYRSSPSVSGDIKLSRNPALSEKFSIDALFTVLTKLSRVKVLSLVSLGMWGQLPSKVSRFRSLEVLNISSNFISGELPQTISTFPNLRSLVLADNLMNGSVPDLRSLLRLQELNLGDNRFGPEFPYLGTGLVSVVLKNNSLRSVIPSGLGKFDRLQEFDVSSNKFVGPIPSPMFNLPSIQYLNLARNQFTGAFQANTSCSRNLRFVDISQNHLIGKLPSCIGSNSSNLTVISSWNCLSGGNSGYQLPNSVCRKEALAVNPTRNTTSQEEKSKWSSRLGLILGVVAGVAGVLVVLGLLTFAIFRKSQRNNNNETNIFEQVSVASNKSPLHTISSKPAITETRHVPTTAGFGTLGLPSYKVFTLEEMEDATNNFDPSNLIAEGSQGQSYKGWVRDGSEVVVKCLKVKQKQKHAPQSLTKQMEAVTKLRHQHLVSILGHCNVTYQDHPHTASTVFIVLEHVGNGSLRDHLTDGRRREILKWPQRLGISIGVARGIQFLHTGNAPGVFGNNLRIQNVLLNEKLTAKISNYNIPLRFKVDSELSRSAQEGERDDVYQFGGILLEMITGKQVTSEIELDELKGQLERGLSEGASKLRGLTDPSIRATFAYESMSNTVQITLNCLSKDSSRRPSIEDVLWNLHYSIQVQEGWASSEGLSTQPYPYPNPNPNP